ncbi:thioredoxin domain-containing protein [Pendulispora brunnea]|uniref:Thioredoxin domain-containing protein n=1 Tax=Pendulispora brunnea TaxID=2905690 RepID=A0ABZ2K964_9BACT
MSKNTQEVRDVPGGVAIIGFFLSFLSGGALMWGYDAHRLQTLRGSESAGADTAPWSDSDSPIPVDSNDPMWGNRLAPVTIVEFSDFECPFCGRVEPALEQIKQNYGPDKVRIIWKHLPIPNHPHAQSAAEAAEGVFALKGSEAFWKFHDLAFRNQNALSPESYERWAQQSGVTDMAKYKAGLASHKWASKCAQDAALSQQLNVNATPAFFINGVAFSGAQPYDKFKAVIDQELGKAQAKIAAGVPKSEIYTRSSKEAKNAPPPPRAEAKDDGLWKVPIGKSPVLGSDKALVTIVAFSDFECVFCKRSEATMKQVRDAYGDKVRFVWKNQPIVSIHKHAEAAAQFALAARAEKGDQGFWDAHAKLFESAPKLEDEDFARMAKELGLSVERVQSAIKEHKYKKEIDADQELADEFAAASTPHYFVNGRRIVGAEPFDRFKGVIDEEIAKAGALLAKGTKPADLYDTLVKDGKGAPDLEKKTLPARINAPTKGNPNAKVTIVEVSDFQCPYCRRAEDTMKEVMKNYGDRVKLTWRHFPLAMHEDAGLAAQASLEAFKQKGSDGFWKMHDLLFAAQPTQNGFKREAMEKYAEQAGLDLAKFKAALDHQTHRAVVDEDVKAVSEAGINSTPGFIINGYFINGAEPYPKFRKVIDRALAESK